MRTEELGNLPDQNVAFAAIERMMHKRREIRDWSTLHPAIHWAVCQINWSEIRNARRQTKRKVFDRVWLEVTLRHKNGFEFPAAPGVSRNTDAQAPANDNVARPVLDNLKAIFS